MSNHRCDSKSIDSPAVFVLKVSCNGLSCNFLNIFWGPSALADSLVGVMTSLVQWLVDIYIATRVYDILYFSGLRIYILTLVCVSSSIDTLMEP